MIDEEIDNIDTSPCMCNPVALLLSKEYHLLLSREEGIEDESILLSTFRGLPIFSNETPIIPVQIAYGQRT